MKKERFFGKNGQTAFLGAAVLVLLICYIDNFHGGSAWIPTYFQHVAVNCLIAAIYNSRIIKIYQHQFLDHHSCGISSGSSCIYSTGNGFPSCKGTVFDRYHLCILRDLTFHRH